MDVRVVLLVICATAASARHFVDVNRYLVKPFNPSSEFTESRRNVEIPSDRRSFDGRNEANLNQQGPNVEPLYRYNSDSSTQNIPESHSIRSHKHQREISENIDRNNNIGNVQTEYKLRTNADTSGKVDSQTLTTEHSEDVNVHTNIKPAVHIQGNNRDSGDLKQDNLPRDNSSVQGPDITQHYRHGDGQEHVSMKPPENKTIAINHNETSFLPNNSKQNDLTHNKGTLFVNSNKKKTDNVRRIIRPQANRPGGNLVKNLRNDTRTIAPESKTPGRNDSIPKVKDDEQEEIAWVWGSEAGNNEVTTEDDLWDRAAFSGDHCPTGKVKVEGLCVDKH